MAKKPNKTIDYVVAFGDNVDSDSLFIDTWLNNGWNEPGQAEINVKDMLATPNANVWMPKVVEEIVREPQEPLTIVPQLLDQIPYDPAAKITMLGMGAITAADIPEGGAYPERMLQLTPGNITVNVSKSGVALKITEEMVMASNFPLINMHILAGKRALDRHKEKKGMNWITGMGVSLFDNISPTTSIFGPCTGRAISGLGNGSSTVEDLHKGYAHVMMQGFVPNVLLMHPLAWSMWMLDPMLQTIVKNTGNGQWFQNASPARQALPWKNASQGGIGLGSGRGVYTPGGNAAGASATAPIDIDQTLQSKAQIPSYFPHPLTVIVTPYVPFDEDNNTTDIFLLDSMNLGAMFVQHGVEVDEWEDMSVDITKIKLKERYGFYIYEDGLGIGVFRNVSIKANEISLPVQATISSAGSLSAIPIDTAVI